MADVTLLKAKAFALAARRLLEVFTHGWPGDAQHLDFELMLPEVLAWLGSAASR